MGRSRPLKLQLASEIAIKWICLECSSRDVPTKMIATRDSHHHEDSFGFALLRRSNASSVQIPKLPPPSGQRAFLLSRLRCYTRLVSIVWGRDQSESGPAE